MKLARIAMPFAVAGLAGAALAGAQPAKAGKAGKADCKYPAQVLDLKNWKETLPLGGKGKPTEVTQPKLATYQVDPWFRANSGCTGVQFRAAVNGVTTGGSKYPRSELREMTDNGAKDAGWSTTAGTHTLVIDEAITHLPARKPQVVAGQIHDAKDDVTVFRLEGTSLYVTNGDDPHGKLIASGYKLGTRFQVKFVVSGGKIQAYYNGKLQSTMASRTSGAYFKAGAYTQANCSNSLPCDAGNYGEVVIYRVAVMHQ